MKKTNTIYTENIEKATFTEDSTGKLTAATPAKVKFHLPSVVKEEFQPQFEDAVKARLYFIRAQKAHNACVFYNEKATKNEEDLNTTEALLENMKKTEENEPRKQELLLETYDLKDKMEENYEKSKKYLLMNEFFLKQCEDLHSLLDDVEIPEREHFNVTVNLYSMIFEQVDENLNPLRIQGVEKLYALCKTYNDNFQNVDLTTEQNEPAKKAWQEIRSTMVEIGSRLNNDGNGCFKKFTCKVSAWRVNSLIAATAQTYSANKNTGKISKRRLTNKYEKFESLLLATLFGVDKKQEDTKKSGVKYI